MPSKILVVIEENHSLAQMRAGMPFLARMSKKYGYATHWKALAHPSEPNYLAIAGGSTFGVTDDEPPEVNDRLVGNARSVFDQALSAGRTAGTYADSMPGTCYAHDAPDKSVGRPVYAVRHNPWVYFPRSRAACRAHDVGLSSFARAARRNHLPNVGFLIPNVVHDAHDASLQAADAWLQQRLKPVLRSRDFRKGRLVVVVTADEDDRHAGNTVLTSVLSHRLHHKVVTSPLTHYSLTRFIGQVLHQPPLRLGRTAPDMRTAFGF
jgi:phosphatidylinositol-3-phosphatase